MAVEHKTELVIQIEDDDSRRVAIPNVRVVSLGSMDLVKLDRSQLDRLITRLMKLREESYRG